MRILAHRGMWTTEKEKNTLVALKRALDNGYGFETDIRDYQGELVISHNIADVSSIKVQEILEYYEKIGSDVQLALNVKADGIQGLLEDLLKRYQLDNYFLFDMSVPELVVNCNRGLTFYTRHSDIEDTCVLYDKASGVWLDSFFEDDWLTKDVIMRHLHNNKPVCIVSPELHQKNYEKVWNMMAECNLQRNQLVSLCTDIPEKAKEYFGL